MRNTFSQIDSTINSLLNRGFGWVRTMLSAQRLMINGSCTHARFSYSCVNMPEVNDTAGSFRTTGACKLSVSSLSVCRMLPYMVANLGDNSPRINRLDVGRTVTANESRIRLAGNPKCAETMQKQHDRPQPVRFQLREKRS